LVIQYVGYLAMGVAFTFTCVMLKFSSTR